MFRRLQGLDFAAHLHPPVQTKTTRGSFDLELQQVRTGPREIRWNRGDDRFPWRRPNGLSIQLAGAADVNPIPVELYIVDGGGDAQGEINRVLFQLHPL